MEFFRNKSKKQKAIKPPVPRQMDELNKVYSDLIGKLGQEELKTAIHTRNANYYKQQLMNINDEAEARGKLDAEAKAKEAKAPQ